MFDILYEGNNHFVKAVEYYLSVDTPTRLSASRIVEYLFNLMDPEKVLQLLQANEYTQKMNGFIITFIISRMIRYRKTPLKIFILSFSMIQIKRLLGLVLEK